MLFRIALMTGTLAALVARDVPAQEAKPLVPLPDMQAIAADLGVDCAYCHGGRGTPTPTGPALTTVGRPRLVVAREMIAMTAALNEQVQAVTGKAPAQAVRIRCATCHRGVAIPRPLQDILWQTTIEQGATAAESQYRELRAKYHGRQSYDFGEDTLLLIADRLATSRPADAVMLARLNMEFFPRSTRSYVTLAIAESRTDIEAAIATLKKALDIEPENSVIKGRIFQWEDDLARRRKRGL